MTTGRLALLVLSELFVVSALWLLVGNDRPALYLPRVLVVPRAVQDSWRLARVTKAGHVIGPLFQWSALTHFEENAAVLT